MSVIDSIGLNVYWKMEKHVTNDTYFDQGRGACTDITFKLE